MSALWESVMQVPALKSLVEEREAYGRMFVTGAVDHLRDELKKADISVLELEYITEESFEDFDPVDLRRVLSWALIMMAENTDDARSQ